MFERPKSGEKAILVQLSLPGVDAEESLREFEELAASAQAEVLGTVTGSRAVPDAKYYAGQGKAQEIADAVQLYGAELVLVNHELSPSQERNLEKLCQCRVVDRSGLILDIFAQRAQTFEGKLQVELAQLEHLSTRLIRGWTHLERQKGGIGLRGPGETQLETDRRLLRERIKSIHKRLEKVRSSRHQNRQARQKADLPTVSLVGYTNAGKSTLFNSLTKESVLAEDKLFATLDPTMRKRDLPGGGSIVLADTVGFIRQLPHQLVEAFRATLEETAQADLLLHVIDVADPRWREHVEAVDTVLKEIGISDPTKILVFNKIDQFETWEARVEYSEDAVPKIWLSAKTGDGIDVLLNLIATVLEGAPQEEQITLRPEEGKIRSELYRLKAVKCEKINDEGNYELVVELTPKQRQRLLVS